MLVPPQDVALSTSVLMAIMNLFAFLSTYWIQTANITGDAIIAPMYVSMGIALVGGVIFSIVNPFPEKRSVNFAFATAAYDYCADIIRVFSLKDIKPFPYGSGFIYCFIYYGLPSYN